MTRESLLLAAVQSGILFLAIAAVFRLVPSIPADAKAWIWRLAFLKPLLFFLPFAVVTFRVLPAPHPSVDASSVVPMDAIPNVLPNAVATPIPAAVPSYDPVMLLWLVGAVVVAIAGIANTLRALGIVRRAKPVESFEILRAFEALQARAEVSGRIRLLTSTEVTGAMLVGGPNPAIVLPASALASGENLDVRLMMAHEIAHLVRRDLGWFGLVWTVQSLFFFKPLVWFDARRARLDHESATDRYASQLAGVPIQTYAEMLLRATVVARPPFVPGTAPMAESYRTIHQRLEAMKHFNSPTSFRRKAAVATLALATVGLLPVYQLAEAAPPLAPQATPAKPAAPATPAKPARPAKPAKPAKPAAPAKPKGKKSQVPTRFKLVSKEGKDQRVYVVEQKEGEWVVLQGGKPVRVYLKKGGKMVPVDLGVKPKPAVPPKVKAAIPALPTRGVSKRSVFPAHEAEPASHGWSPKNASNAVPGVPAMPASGIGATSARPAQVPNFVTVHRQAGNSTEFLELSFTNVDVREALRAIFRETNKSFIIDPAVQGIVTVSLYGVSLEVTLRQLATMVDATVNIRDGVYTITPKV